MDELGQYLIGRDSVSSTTLKGRGCDILVNVDASSKDKENDIKDSFYQEIE